MLNFCLIVAVLLCLSLPATAKENEIKAVAFSALAEELFDGIVARKPTLGFRLGLSHFAGDLPHSSQEATHQTLAWLDESLLRLEEVDQRSLSPLQHAEWAVLHTTLSEWAFLWRTQRQPQRDPLHIIDSVRIDALVLRNDIPLHKRAQAAFQMAQAAPPYLSSSEALLDYQLPSPLLETAIHKSRNASTFVSEVALEAFSKLTSTVNREALQQALRDLARAQEHFALQLEARREVADQNFRLGKEAFLTRLKLAHGLELSVKRIQQLCKADLARNRAVMAEVAQQIDSTKSVAEVVKDLQAQKPSAKQRVAVARDQIELLRKGVIQQNLASIPAERTLLIREVSPYSRLGTNQGSLFLPGPFESRAPPFFYLIRPADPSWPMQRQRNNQPSIEELRFASARETWPGRYLQALHLEQIPSPILQAFGSSATREGWAHYAEEIVIETDIARGPEAAVGQLLNALLSDVRCLSAIGFHTGRMSIARSERLFRQHAYQNEESAREQARRGTFDPMYLVATLGKLAIYEMREDYRAKRAADMETFELRSFHDRFLAHGNAPLPVIRKALLGNAAGSPLVR